MSEWDLFTITSPWSSTCECGGLGHGAVLVLGGDDAGAGTEGRRRHEGQLLHDAAAARVVLGQLAQPLLQGELEQVQLLTGLVEAGLGLGATQQGGSGVNLGAVHTHAMS